MLAKRIIACLDVMNGRTVKGVHFEGLRDAGDAVGLAARYFAEGVDELVFLDITATVEKRATLVSLVTAVSRELAIPFTVGGGVTSVEDARALLYAGADKVTVNSAAVRRPALLNELAAEFGSQAVVLAIDAKQELVVENAAPQYSDTGDPGIERSQLQCEIPPTQAQSRTWRVYVNGGRLATEREVLPWALEAQERGAGEVLLTSMDHDGTKDGFALELTAAVSSQLRIPVIASGGAGCATHFVDVFTKAGADAALAASIFHFAEVSIPALKATCLQAQIPMRL